MNPLVKLLVRVGCWLVFRLGLYYHWSRIYRAIWQRRFRGDVRPRRTLAELQDIIRFKTWKRDLAFELGDAIGWPRFFEFASDDTKLGRDCDEYAIWICNASREGIEHKGERLAPAGIASTVWPVGNRVKGHNVAILMNDRLKLYHCSNAHRGRLFGPFDHELDVAFHIAGMASTRPLAFNLRSSDLKHGMAYHWIGGRER